MPKKDLLLPLVYRLIESGPVVLLSTFRYGRPNVMTMSWHTMMEFEPPIIGCIISNRDYTFGLLKATKKCVINIPTVELAPKVVRCGNTTGRSIDKFKTIGLTPQPASCVHAPLIAECYANLECKVIDTKLVNQYNFFILEVVKAWIDRSIKSPRTLHHLGKGSAFRILRTSSSRTSKAPASLRHVAGFPGLGLLRRLRHHRARAR